MTAPVRQRSRIPRLADDYTRAAAAGRTGFLRAVTGASPEHIGRYSVDPADGRVGELGLQLPAVGHALVTARVP
jgi:hypothetical protein